MSIHPHSLQAYHEGKRHLFSERENEILNALERLGPSTDRRIRTALGYEDLNAVRPRITELHQKGVLQETGSAVDAVTGKRVRISSIIPSTGQTAFSF